MALELEPSIKSSESGSIEQDDSPTATVTSTADEGIDLQSSQLNRELSARIGRCLGVTVFQCSVIYLRDRTADGQWSI
jgi:hypothetical protein